MQLSRPAGERDSEHLQKLGSVGNIARLACSGMRLWVQLVLVLLLGSIILYDSGERKGAPNPLSAVRTVFEPPWRFLSILSSFLCQALLCSFLLLVLNCFFLSLCFFWDLAPLSTSFYSLNDEDNNRKLLALFPSYGAAGVLSDYSWNVVDFPCFEDSRDHFVQSLMFLRRLLCICILFSPKILFPFFSPFPCLWAMPISCRWFSIRFEAFSGLKPQKRVCFLFCGAWRRQMRSISQRK